MIVPQLLPFVAEARTIAPLTAHLTPTAAGAPVAATLTSLSPAAAFVGGAAFTLTVNGSGFDATSAVQWNGAARPTTVQSATLVTAAIAAADLAAAGSASVTVVNSNPDLAGQIAAAQANVQALQSQLAAQQALVAQTQTQITGLNVQIATAQAQVSEAQATLAAAQTQLANAQSSLTAANAQKAALQTQILQLQTDITTTEQAIAAAQAAVTDQIALLDAEIAALQASIAPLELQRQVALEAQEAELLRRENAVLTRDATQAELDLLVQESEAQIQALNNEIAVLNEQLAAALANGDQAAADNINILLGVAQGGIDTVLANLSSLQAAYLDTIDLSNQIIVETTANIQTYMAEVEAIQAQIAPMQGNLAALLQQRAALIANAPGVATLTAQLAAQNAAKAQAEADLATINQQIAAQTATAAAAQAAVDAATTQLAAAQPSLDGLNASLATAQDTLAAAQAAVVAAQTALAAAQAELAALQAQTPATSNTLTFTISPAVAETTPPAWAVALAQQLEDGSYDVTFTCADNAGGSGISLASYVPALDPGSVTYSASNGGSLSFVATVAAGTTASAADLFLNEYGNGVQPCIDVAGNVATNASYTAQATAPALTLQPTDETAAVGEGVEFMAEASGAPVPTVQWQVSTNGGASFSNIGGATDTVFAIAATTAGQDGNRYRAVFTSLGGSATSAAAILRVVSPPVIDLQPDSQTVAAGSQATFAAEASSPSGAPAVQWQIRANGGASFANVDAGTTTTTNQTTATQTTSHLSLTMTAELDGAQFRAVFSNAAGTAVTDAAALGLFTPNTGAPVITNQPLDRTVRAGANARFQAAASGAPMTSVQWQVKEPGASDFTNVAGGTKKTAAGVTTATLAVKKTELADSGAQYRVIFTNVAGPTASNAAILTVVAKPQTTSSPTAQTVSLGGTATFTAAASGVPAPAVKWQVRPQGAAVFTDIPGATSPTLVVSNVTTGQHRSRYRAVFTNVAGTATTAAAVLKVNVPPTVTVQPLHKTVRDGRNAAFTAKATGTPAPTVQWQVSADGGATFSDLSGETRKRLVVRASLLLGGNQYRAVFTNPAGSATSAAATLTVQPRR